MSSATTIDVSQKGTTVFSINIASTQARKAAEVFEASGSIGDSPPMDLKNTRVFDVSVRNANSEITRLSYVRFAFCYRSISLAEEIVMGVILTVVTR